MVKFKKDSFSGKRGNKPTFLKFNKTNGVEKNEKTGKAARVEKGVDVLLDLIQAKAKKKLNDTEKTSKSSSWEKKKSAPGGKMKSASGGKMNSTSGGKMNSTSGGYMKPALGGKMKPAPGGKIKPASRGNMKSGPGGKRKSTPQGEIQYNTVNSTSEEMKYDKDFVKNEVYNFQGRWSSELPAVPNEPWNPPSQVIIQKYKKQAEALYEQEIANYEKNMKGESDSNWLKLVLDKGTIQDKMAAALVHIRSSTVHGLNSLENILSQVNLKCRRFCYPSIDAIVTILSSDLLIPDKKLTSFDKNPFHILTQLSETERNKALFLWWFQHKLKQFYARFLEALDEIGKDFNEKSKELVLEAYKTLLICNPEKEHILLTKLVNKLGDPVHNIAKKAFKSLEGLLELHPAMKRVVVEEVKRFLYIPNMAQKSQTRALAFLSQVKFIRNDPLDIAGKLVLLYFDFFKVVIKKGEIESRMMSTILNGVNNAFPYSKIDVSVLEENINTIYTMIHLVCFNTSIQGFQLLYSLLDAKVGLTDRYYTTLYSKIFDPGFRCAKNKVVFLNLLFNSMKRDSQVERVRSYIKRVLQTCEYMPPNVAAGLLIIVSELLKARTDLDIAVKRPSGSGINLSRFDYSDDEDDEHFNDINEEEQQNNENKTMKQKGIIFRKEKSDDKESETYDPFKRNPTYAKAEYTELWELASLTSYYHPSVSLFATNVCEKKTIDYPGDPIEDFTNIKFLERFAFRNPKIIKDTDHMSYYAKKKLYKPTSYKALQPGSAEYMACKPEALLDEKFLYDFFVAMTEREMQNEVEMESRGQVKQKEEDADLEDSEDEEETEEFGDVDFSSGLRKNKNRGMDKKNKKKRKGDSSDEESDLGSEEESDGEDGEPEMDGEGFGSYSEGSDIEGADGQGEQDLDFSDEDDGPPKKKRKQADTKGKKETKAKKKPLGKKNVFKNDYDLDEFNRMAEKFGEILERNKNSGDANEYVVKGKVHAKQLKWERQQEETMKGRDHWRGGGRFKKYGHAKGSGNKFGKKKFGKKK